MNNFIQPGLTMSFLKNTQIPILRSIRIKYKTIRDYYYKRKRLKYLPLLRKHFPPGISIISNNCFAGRIYQDLYQPYLSPTVGLTILYPDYITFVERLDYYRSQPIEWVSTSKYPRGEEMRKNWKHWYPIGLIGEELEIHFLHYYTKEEALEKWKRRCERINMKNLFVVAAAQGNCTEEMVLRFSKLPFQKVFLVKERYKTKYPNVIYVKEFKKGGADPYRRAHIYYKYILNYLESKNTNI